jgi:hypothetical protein
MITITHHIWADNVESWSIESDTLGLIPCFSAQQAADYVFERNLSATWTTIRHDH